jgi:hypothetical protein
MKPHVEWREAAASDGIDLVARPIANPLATSNEMDPRLPSDFLAILQCIGFGPGYNG